MYFYSVVAVFFIMGIGYVQAQCPPRSQDIQMIVKFLEKALDTVKKTKPGTDPRDADFVINKVAKDIINSKKYAPCNNGFQWSDVNKDAQEIKVDCYKPSDFSKEAPQKAFMDCVKKHAPQLILRYGTPAINACSCFGEKVVPQWDSKYKKFAGAYVEEFRTLKHRKK